ncbi:MAG: hypothetical protein RIC55_04075 [Pirellulaceae bacterium]
MKKDINPCLAVMLAASVLLAFSCAARGEDGKEGENAKTSALIRFVEVAPAVAPAQKVAPEQKSVQKNAQKKSTPDKPAPVTAPPAEVRERASKGVVYRISSQTDAADRDARPDDDSAPTRRPAVARISDQSPEPSESESQLVGFQSTIRVHVKQRESDQTSSSLPTSKTPSPDVDSTATVGIPSLMAPRTGPSRAGSEEDSTAKQDAKDAAKSVLAGISEKTTATLASQKPQILDYRLTSRGPSLVLMVEPTIGEELERDPATSQPQSPEVENLLRAAVESDDDSSANSLIVLAQPLEAGGLEEVATLKADPALLNDEGLRPIGQVGADIRPEVGELPTDYAGPLFARVGEIHQSMGATRDWGMYAFSWEAKGLCYGPLRFEEVNLERHGYSLGLVQPAVSAAHFFGTLPMLPYKMAATSRWNCQYSLGHYRPGSYAPFRYNRTPLRLSAAAVQAAAVMGAVLVFP